LVVFVGPPLKTMKGGGPGPLSIKLPVFPQQLLFQPLQRTRKLGMRHPKGPRNLGGQKPNNAKGKRAKKGRLRVTGINNMGPPKAFPDYKKAPKEIKIASPDCQSLVDKRQGGKRFQRGTSGDPPFGQARVSEEVSKGGSPETF